jgi:hypothetical protein
MPTLVMPTNLQKMEFDVTTTEGASRVTIVTGTMPIDLSAFDNTGNTATGNGSFKALIDPTLMPGQFRKATATVSFGAISQSAQATPVIAHWLLSDVNANFDDEAGQVQLIVDVTVRATGPSAFVHTSLLTFQVTTLAKI